MSPPNALARPGLRRARRFTSLGVRVGCGRVGCGMCGMLVMVWLIAGDKTESYEMYPRAETLEKKKKRTRRMAAAVVVLCTCVRFGLVRWERAGIKNIPPRYIDGINPTAVNVGETHPESLFCSPTGARSSSSSTAIFLCTTVLEYIHIYTASTHKCLTINARWKATKKNGCPMIPCIRNACTTIYLLLLYIGDSHHPVTQSPKKRTNYKTPTYFYMYATRYHIYPVRFFLIVFWSLFFVSARVVVFSNPVR